jgi:carboxyl-terminal processing protease
VGQPTYGKGCAQEYLDDDVRVGVLRLTTLLYALPDGSPVQGVGLEPSLLLPSDAHGSAHFDAPGEREADVPNAPPTWRGPDVRDRTQVPPRVAAWPEHRGRVGPCRDPEVCRALVALGSGGAKHPTAALTQPAPMHH